VTAVRADRFRGLLAVAAVLSLPMLSGCLTARQQAVLWQQPANRVLNPDKIDMTLPAGKAYSLSEYDRCGTQDMMLLLLAPNAKLEKRYHKLHDMTLVMLRGAAIVTVEETRYFVGPGSAVFLPRMTAYSVEPQKPADGSAPSQVAALLVFTPPYDPEDAYRAD
jgi:mannose-6-phosphate isomerase-like protein (cupin superfamily)